MDKHRRRNRLGANMKKLLLALFILSLTVKAYPSPTSSMSIIPAAVNGATIEAADENDRNTIVSSTYNAHDHNDIDQTANGLNIGDGTAGNKTITAYTNDAIAPIIKYNDIGKQWVMAIEGVTSSVILSGQDISFEGATADAYETQINITDPTADRFQILQDNTGIIPLATIGNSLFITTTGATGITLPTSGLVIVSGQDVIFNNITASKITTTNLTAGNITSTNITATFYNFTMPSGTAPMSVLSTTKVTNLNADLLDNFTSSDFAFKQLFTANGTWASPSGITTVFLSMCGGGGGGQSSIDGDSAGSGGGGGEALIKFIYTVTPSTNYAVVVGQGGAGGTGTAGVGGFGGNTTFGTITMEGGDGGATSAGGVGGNLNSAIGIINGSNGIGGGINSFSGGTGETKNSLSNSTGGGGGGSKFGNGGNADLNGTGWGSGGGGSNTEAYAGNGAKGFCLVEY
jgi:hypothetical protein